MSKAIFWMMAGSTALQAYGKYQEGKRLKDLNEYNAAILENNKVLADRKLANEINYFWTMKIRTYPLVGVANRHIYVEPRG